MLDFGQLKRIYRMLGTFETNYEWIKSPFAKEWLKKLPPKVRKNLKEEVFMDCKPNITDNACDLMNQMLTLNPNLRINSTDAFNHPWIESDLFESHLGKQNIDYDITNINNFYNGKTNLEFEQSIQTSKGARKVMFDTLKQTQNMCEIKYM